MPQSFVAALVPVSVSVSVAVLVPGLFVSGCPAGQAEDGGGGGEILQTESKRQVVVEYQSDGMEQQM